MRKVERKCIIKYSIIKDNYNRQKTMKFSQGLGVILGTTTLALVQYQTVFALTPVEVNDIAKPEMLNVVTKLYIFKYSSIIKGKNVNIS